jgi:hypothetical protein
MRLRLLLVVLPLVFMGVPSVGHAGYTNPNGVWCTTNPDGSGYCHASFAAFRNDPDPGAYAVFVQSNSTYRYFSASWNGNSYMCWPDEWAAAAWPAALTSRSEFYVSWDAAAVCHQVVIYNATNTH